jgi:hypothetical protein
MKPRRSVFKTVIAPIVVTVALIPTLAIAVWEVLHGRGAATYSNVYGLPIQYTSVLILVLVLALTLAVAYIARIIYFWRNSRDGATKLRKIDSLGSSVDSGEEK